MKSGDVRDVYLWNSVVAKVYKFKNNKNQKFPSKSNQINRKYFPTYKKKKTWKKNTKKRTNAKI